MNRLISGRSAVKFFAASAVLLSSLSVVSCHDANAGKDRAESSLGEPRPDDALLKLMRSLAEGDAPGFASLCIYPIMRPYPLKNIEDSVSMVDYFPMMVDDSIRMVFSNTKLDDWENFGWRGWSLSDSKPLWFDEGVQVIDYVSKAESGLKSILAREEIMSLAPDLREGWLPVTTLVQIDGPRVYRIDANGDSFRLMQFDDPSRAHEHPAMLLLGTLHNEGSADSPVFEFASSDGTKAQYLPDAEPPVCIHISRPRTKDEAVEVAPAYWRDIVK